MCILRGFVDGFGGGVSWDLEEVGVIKEIGCQCFIDISRYFIDIDDGFRKYKAKFLETKLTKPFLRLKSQ